MHTAAHHEISGPEQHCEYQHKIWHKTPLNVKRDVSTAHVSTEQQVSVCSLISTGSSSSAKANQQLSQQSWIRIFVGYLSMQTIHLQNQSDESFRSLHDMAK